MSVNLDELNEARDKFLRLLTLAHASHGRSITYTATCKMAEDGSLIIEQDGAVVSPIPDRPRRPK